MTEHKWVGWVERSETHQIKRDHLLAAHKSRPYTSPRASVGTRRNNTGFTLLELLVVITLLGIVAGAVVLGYEGVQDQGREDVTRFEMAEIRKALLQFRRDSGSNDFPGQGIYDCTDSANGGSATDANTAMTFPAEAGDTEAEKIAWCKNPANFWMLFSDPIGEGWDKDRKRGWNGPYLQRKSGLLAYASESDLWGINGPYQTPYLMIDLHDNDKARVVAIGSNNAFEGEGGTPCVPPDNSDDNVLCLLR